MKSGLILPRFSATGVVEGDRVDEHIRLMAAQVNGGLTLHNLAASTRFATTHFAEPKNIYCLTGKVENTFNDGQGGTVCVGATSTISNICGVSVVAAVFSPNFASNAFMTIIAGDGNQNGLCGIFSTNVPMATCTEEPLWGGDFLLAAGYQHISHTVNFPSGTVFHVQFTPGLSTGIGQYTLWLKSVHTT